MGWKQASLRGITRVDPSGDCPSFTHVILKLNVMWCWKAHLRHHRPETQDVQMVGDALGKSVAGPLMQSSIQEQFFDFGNPLGRAVEEQWD